MSGKMKNALRDLIDSFVDSQIGSRLPDLHDYVDHNESGLALEMLSDWIYEDDVEVSSDQTKAILELSSRFGVSADYHAFIGRTPPYPDLRTPEQRTSTKT
jgi:hypothetical protein